jgi:hypothetical protein
MDDKSSPLISPLLTGENFVSKFLSDPQQQKIDEQREMEEQVI